ncbi:hypothetical protein H0H81_006812, partial [Sphagnurus paluster]
MDIPSHIEDMSSNPQDMSMNTEITSAHDAITTQEISKSDISTVMVRKRPNPVFNSSDSTSNTNKQPRSDASNPAWFLNLEAEVDTDGENDEDEDEEVDYMEDFLDDTDEPLAHNRNNSHHYLTLECEQFQDEDEWDALIHCAHENARKIPAEVKHNIHNYDEVPSVTFGPNTWQVAVK